MQATVVALYGAKPATLCQLLTQMQSAVRQLLGPRFRSYDIQQIHATVIGLERDESHPDQYLNRNFQDFQRTDTDMDFGGLIQYLRYVFSSPMKIQIGGFQDREYSFSSRGKRPFERSFSIRGSNVLGIGWPRRDPSDAGPSRTPATANSCPPGFPDSLCRVRKAAERYGVLHAHHRQPDDADNDFYFRLGTLDDPITLDSVMHARVQHAVRQMLSLQSPLTVEIHSSNVSLAFYESEELRLYSTRSYPLDWAPLDAEFIRRAYGVSTG